MAKKVYSYNDELYEYRLVLDEEIDEIYGFNVEFDDSDDGNENEIQADDLLEGEEEKNRLDHSGNKS